MPPASPQGTQDAQVDIALIRADQIIDRDSHLLNRRSMRDLMQVECTESRTKDAARDAIKGLTRDSLIFNREAQALASMEPERAAEAHSSAVRMTESVIAAAAASEWRPETKLDPETGWVWNENGRSEGIEAVTELMGNGKSPHEYPGNNAEIMENILWNTASGRVQDALQAQTGAAATAHYEIAEALVNLSRTTVLTEADNG